MPPRVFWDPLRSALSALFSRRGAFLLNSWNAPPARRPGLGVRLAARDTQAYVREFLPFEGFQNAPESGPPYRS